MRNQQFKMPIPVFYVISPNPYLQVVPSLSQWFWLCGPSWGLVRPGFVIMADFVSFEASFGLPTQGCWCPPPPSQGYGRSGNQRIGGRVRAFSGPRHLLLWLSTFSHKLFLPPPDISLKGFTFFFWHSMMINQQTCVEYNLEFLLKDGHKHHIGKGFINSTALASHWQTRWKQTQKSREGRNIACSQRRRNQWWSASP